MTAERERALEELARLHAEVDERTAALAALHAQRLHCKRGCSACCVDEITVFEIEAENIRGKHEALLARGEPHAPGACAFLDAEGACRIYAERPYVCRTHGLPLAWIAERKEVPEPSEPGAERSEPAAVELRDICALNEKGTPLEELPREQVWAIGPFEERLRAIQEFAHEGALTRVPLRSLFARGPVLEAPLVRLLSEALDEIDAGGRWSEVLRELFRREGWLGPAKRGALVAALAALLQEERRSCAALEGQLPRATPLETAQALHLASLLLTGRIDLARALRELPSVKWERVLAFDRELCESADPVLAFAQRAALPEFLARPLLAEFGAEASALAAAWRSAPKVALRANRLRGTREELRARLMERGIITQPGTFARDALLLDGRANAFEWPEFAAGLFELQDEASQLVAELVAPPPKSLVIDFCAGAGGKTLALAALLGNKGRVLALDPHSGRLEELRKRAARAGAFNVIAARTPGDGAKLAPELEGTRGKAERVLVDAPCSGLGALRRKPDVLRRLDERTLERLPREQLAIAREASRWLAPGGRLVYSTCTVLRAENEAVVEALLAEGGLELVHAREVLGGALGDKVCTSDGRFVKLVPHVHGTDGFFAAVLRKPRA